MDCGLSTALPNSELFQHHVDECQGCGSTHRHGIVMWLSEWQIGVHSADRRYGITMISRCIARPKCLCTTAHLLRCTCRQRIDGDSLAALQPRRGGGLRFLPCDPDRQSSHGAFWQSPRGITSRAAETQTISIADSTQTDTSARASRSCLTFT